jgi:nitroreductase
MAEKSLSQAIKEWRATRHYEPTAVQEDDLRRILEAALAAPSGFQPWRFVVVRYPEQRKRLREIAMG